MRLNSWLTRPLPKLKKAIKSDPQRHIVYNMERNLIGNCIHTTTLLEHMNAVARHACNKRHITPPIIKTYNKPKVRVFGNCYPDKITMNRGFHGCNMVVLLHELAHYIDWNTEGHEGEGSPDHGPRWAGIYLDLLSQYRIMSQDAAIAMFDEYGVDWE
jgi:hypothetical protein